MDGFDVCVCGSGAVGQALALSLSRLGLRVALAGGPARAGSAQDVRTYALNARSVALLTQCKVWDALLARSPCVATRVEDMRVAGDRGGALEFTAWQQCVSELAWIVDAAALEAELDAALRFAPHVTRTEAPVPATLLAVCEGKDSRVRDALGVKVDRVDYGQRAVAARLASDQPHQARALQWFASPDVLALLPFDLPGEAGGYGLVWSLPEARAQELLQMDAPAFEQALNEATHGQAGRLALRSERMSWPLRMAQARRWHGPGWVLLGDAAHVVHPLAGQGLNLGLADVDTLVDVIVNARRDEPWRALSDERMLARYERARLAPTWAMVRLTDGLLRLFAPSQPVLASLRNNGLFLVDHLSALKRWLARRALQG
jgi:2-polyprenyl-6-methoxyphenol hydroxylase-like FAD-dependent oxidoreductase